MKNTKLKRFSLKERAYHLLFEQEDDEPTDDAESTDDAEDDLFGDDEEGGDDDDAAGDDVDFSGGGGGGSGGGGGMSGGDSGETGGSAEEPEEVEVSPEEEYKLSDSIDQELDSLMVDFEEEARKSASVNKPVYESIFLFEEASADIDLRHFAGNVARFVKNYQNLIDWESVILNKAKTFVINNYGEETATALFDILEQEYDLKEDTKQEEAPAAPIAVGATGEGGGGI